MCKEASVANMKDFVTVLRPTNVLEGSSNDFDPYSKK